MGISAIAAFALRPLRPRGSARKTAGGCRTDRSGSALCPSRQPPAPAGHSGSFGRELPVQRVDIVHRDENSGAGRAVAIVFAQVQRQSGAGHLHVQRQIFAETVLPLQRETEKVQIELFGLVDRKMRRIGMAGEKVIIVDLTVTLAAADMDIDRLGAGIGFEVGQEAAFDFRGCSK